jgi:hypothetical protein
MPGETRRDCRRCGLELARQCVCSDADRYADRHHPQSGSVRCEQCVYFCLLGATTRATRHEPEPAGSPRASWLPRREPCDQRLLLCGSVHSLGVRSDSTSECRPAGARPATGRCGVAQLSRGGALQDTQHAQNQVDNHDGDYQPNESVRSVKAHQSDATGRGGRRGPLKGAPRGFWHVFAAREARRRAASIWSCDSPRSRRLRFVQAQVRARLRPAWLASSSSSSGMASGAG